MGILILILCLLLLPTFLFLMAKNRPSNLPPGPRPLPVIGNLHLLGAKPHRSLANLAKTHGPIMCLKLGQVTSIIISSHSAARLVLQKQDQSFANRFIPDSTHSCDNYKFSVVWIPATTPKWRQLRKLCNTFMFSKQKMDCNKDLMNDKVAEMVADVRRKCSLGEAVVIGEAAFKTSLNMLSRMIFSVDLDDDDNEKSETSREFKERFWKLMELEGMPNLADFFPRLARFDPQRIRKRLEPHNSKMLSFFDTMIDRRFAERDSVIENQDVLDNLLNLMQDAREDLTRDDINHLLLDLFEAGTDTTASTLEWAMTEILRNPKVLSNAKSELEQAIERGRPIGDEDIEHLPYLQAILKETLRLHPPTPLLIPRVTFESVELAGFTIPKGAQVLVNAWAIGRDPCTWENPECFDPERFMKSSNVSYVGGNFELVPFGGGRRICPGLPLAVKMLQLMLGSLLNCFGWKLEDGVRQEDIDMDDKFGLTLNKCHPFKAVPLPI